MKISERYIECKVKVQYVTNAEHLEDYRLKISFSDGKVMEIDFLPFLSSSDHQDVKHYLDLSHFKSFELFQGNIVWGDYDMLFPIQDLYKGIIG